MKFITEELGEIEDVTVREIQETLEADSFGKFAILASSEATFVQAACDWSATEECRQFLKERGSDPWILEFHDATTGNHLQAVGHVTLHDVQVAFVSYLSDTSSWRSRHAWKPITIGANL